MLIAACAELGISILNNSALPIYFTQGLKIPTGTYGLLMIPFFISEVLFKSPLGVLADRFGRKPLMLGGALVTVFTPLIFITTHYDPLAVTAVITLLVFGFLRALDGLGQAALWPSLYAYVGDVVAEKKRGAAMGVLNVVYMVGLALSFLDRRLRGRHIRPAVHPPGDVRGADARAWGIAFNTGMHTVGHGLHGALAAPRAGCWPSGPASPPRPRRPRCRRRTSSRNITIPSFILASVLFGIAVIAALAVRGRVRRRRHEPGGAGARREP